MKKSDQGQGFRIRIGDHSYPAESTLRIAHIACEMQSKVSVVAAVVCRWLDDTPADKEGK